MFIMWSIFDRRRVGALVLLSWIITAFVQASTLISRPTYETLNDRPIVGILTQEVGSHSQLEKDEKFESYIAASYVKFIEGGGARVVPLW